MLSKFWDKLGEELAKQWSMQELGPTLVFWLGGFLTWAWHEYYLDSWERLTEWLTGLKDPLVIAGLLLGGLLLFLASSTAAGWLELPVLRLAAGYLPRWLAGLQLWLAQLWVKPIQRWEKRWRELSEIDEQARTAKEQYRYARLDAQRARYPRDLRSLMPTSLGNLLAAAEEHAWWNYGLTTSVCWPRLWLLLPKETQTALTTARRSLNSAARFFLWGLLFAVWSVWAWWSALVALAIVIAAYWAMIQAASVYGDLLRAAFDLYRFDLYKALRLPAPGNPDEDVTRGEGLSEYLFRGIARDIPKFIEPK